MKLVQLNLWQGRLLLSALAFLKQEKPDILCLQEVNSSEIGGFGFFDTNSLERLVRELDLPNYFLSPRFSYQFMHTRSLYGNAILSRFPIAHQETRFTHGEFAEDIVLSKDNHSMSNAQLAIIEAGERHLNVINHHGYYQPYPEGNETSVASMQKVTDWVGELSGPVIITGDLNVWPQSPAMQPLNNLGFTNLTVEHNVQSTLSKVHEAVDRDGIACDYILASKDITIKNFEVSEKLVSDHKALILEFEF